MHGSWNLGAACRVLSFQTALGPQALLGELLRLWCEVPPTGTPGTWPCASGLPRTLGHEATQRRRRRGQLTLSVPTPEPPPFPPSGADLSAQCLISFIKRKITTHERKNSQENPSSRRQGAALQVQTPGCTCRDWKGQLCVCGKWGGGGSAGAAWGGGEGKGAHPRPLS